MIINIYSKVAFIFIGGLFSLLLVFYKSNSLRQYITEYALLVLGILIIYAILSQRFFKKKLSCIEELQNRVALDSLTGLYNKTTTRNTIVEYLNVSKNETHALFVIDIDDFKVVNDRYGHLTGDNLLKNIASNIKEIFREDDVVGRFGGDEFVVFMRNIPSNEALVDKANSLCKVLNKNFVGSYGSISGSIGIAIFPQNGTDYYSLFESADKAMYSAKRQGKNCYCIYEDNVNVNSEDNKFTSCRRVNDYTSSINHISSYIFKTLYRSYDMDSALNDILKYVGKYFKVDRAYIYETNEEGNVLTNTYQWCNQTISHENIQVKSIKSNNLLKYWNEFGVNEMYYCNNSNELPHYIRHRCETAGVTAFIHGGILRFDNFKGFIGFDWYQKGGRIWTSDEIEAIRVISEIISVFIDRKRNDNMLQRERDITRVLVDNSDMYTYVINKDTHKILFISKALQDMTGARVGDNCHSIIRGSEASCRDCPLHNYGPNEGKKVTIMKDKLFNGEVQVTLSNLTWIDGSNACAVHIKQI